MLLCNEREEKTRGRKKREGGKNEREEKTR
jgi:hypothetical protein